MSWSNICVEGFCFGDKDNKGTYPCGQRWPTPFCLMNGQCPHLDWGETTERNVAHYTPLYLIVCDRIPIWVDNVYWRLRWWVWDRLWFNRRKTNAFFDSIPIVTGRNCPAVKKLEDEHKKSNELFPKWFHQATKDWQHNN